MMTFFKATPQDIGVKGLAMAAAIVVATVAALVPETALADASTITSGTTGFDKVAKDVYELATGGLGKTIATLGIVSGLVGLATGFNTRASLAAGGTGFAVAAGPPLVVGFAGTGIF